jgi:hypothetical protein
MNASFLVTPSFDDEIKLKHFITYMRLMKIPFSYIDSMYDVEDLLCDHARLINDDAVGNTFAYTASEI